jgi:hypothetical protein
MNAIALNDLELNAELDNSALGSILGGYLASGWTYSGISTGNFSSWRTTHYQDMGYHSWRGKAYRVYRRFQKRTRTQSQTRRRDQWYD